MLCQGDLGERENVAVDIAHFLAAPGVPYLFVFKAAWGVNTLPRFSVALFIHYFYAR